ncbi:DUF4349 domain-containing protein [Kribbella qitaiheensis]|nr:DUF4349 domain-containing protein [Kribbella qitaiheensis]
MTRTRITAAAAGVILAAAVLLSACSAGDAGNSSGDTQGAAVPAPEKAQGDASQADGKAPQSGGGAADQPAVTRAIIKTGSLTVEADDVDAQRQKAGTIVTGLNGQVATEDSGSDADGRITRANLVLKVPTASFEKAIQQLSGLGRRTAIHQESTDATEAVVDVASRISTQRAGLERMRALLTKATTIGEIVAVESELTRRESDLEALLAKQKALAGQTELATLSLILAEPGKAPVVEKDDTGFLAGLKGGWHAFVATLTVLLTALGALLPFLIALALIGVPLWRYRHRFRRTPVPATATAGGSAPGAGVLPPPKYRDPS